MRKVFILLLAGLVFLSGCAKLSEEKRKREAKELYAEGLAEFRKKDYDDAADSFKEALKFIDYLSPYQIQRVRYLIGKSYYLDKDYVNAIIYLEDFIFYYPKVAETHEAYYMLIDSYLKVAPDEHRDQTYTLKAIEKARDFLSKFPNSDYALRVRDLIDVAYTKVAKYEYNIARFYEEYGYHYSAAMRYRDVLINFSAYLPEEELTYRYIRSLLLSEEQAKKEKDWLNTMVKDLKKKLKKAKNEEEKKAISKRLEFFNGELRRWDRLVQEAKREALELMEKYRRVYGENGYYKKLERIKRRAWKS